VMPQPASPNAESVRVVRLLYLANAEGDARAVLCPFLTHASTLFVIFCTAL
jgi:hypothetical protein